MTSVPSDALRHVARGLCLPMAELVNGLCYHVMVKSILCSSPYKLHIYLLSTVMEKGEKGPRLLAAMSP